MITYNINITTLSLAKAICFYSNLLSTSTGALCRSNATMSGKYVYLPEDAQERDMTAQA